MSSAQQDLRLKAFSFYVEMKARKSCRHFTNYEIDIDVLKTCVLAAGTAPSGANKQPWFFTIVTSNDIKKQIRKSAEKEELEFYSKKASATFLEDLRPLKTTWQKPHLEEASALIVIFSKLYEIRGESKTKCYYPSESVGIASGVLITALHRLGYATLTHTPNPLSFLNNVLKRPINEKPFLILAVGSRSEVSEKLNLEKKSFNEICEVV